ncbi:hypothetical protein HK405_013546 [Cladochytrium tenue]|nr:hypothetical protein HK405_013546 [Cladochytrium tenue]
MEVGSELRLVSFLARSSMAWQVWKETEPELHLFLEQQFDASCFEARPTGDERVFTVEFETPAAVVGKFERAFRDGPLAVEIDKIHGVDPAVGRKDVRLSNLTITAAAPQPRSHLTRHTLEELEAQLVRVEQLERARAVDLRYAMDRLRDCQLDFQRRFDELDRAAADMAARLDAKCDRLDRAIARLPRGTSRPPSTA